MLTEIQTAIIDHLLARIPELRTVDAWQGEIEELVKTAHLLPSVHLAYGSGEYDDQPACIGGAIARKAMVWNAIITAANRRDRASGTTECYLLVEAVVSALKRFDTGHGWLWPVREELLYSKHGLSVYGVSFVMQNDN